MEAKLYPWQEKLLVDIESGGVKPGEMVVMMSGRQIGKSQFSAQAFKRLWDDIYKERPVEDLIMNEGTVFGAKYFTVEPIGGNWKDMEAWAKQSFGEPADIWEKDKFMWPECGRWYMNNRKFWFRNERDRDWFIIKWRA